MSKSLKADLMLVLVTICWGASYYLTDISLVELQPMTLNAYRFLIAFVVAFLILFPKVKKVNKTTLKYSLLVAIALMFVYIGATYGLLYTSVSNAGFLGGLVVIFTPIFGFIFKKQIPDRKFVIIVIICTIGIALLTLNEQLKLAKGDLLCIMCAVAYAADLLITETAVQKEEVDALQLGVYQLGFVGLMMLIMAFAIEQPCAPKTIGIWGAVLFLAIFATGVAFVVQAIAQQHTSASHTGLIFTLEPIFSAIVAFIFAHEVLTPRAYIGAVLMVGSMIAMEIDFKALKEKLILKEKLKK